VTVSPADRRARWQRRMRVVVLTVSLLVFGLPLVAMLEFSTRKVPNTLGARSADP